MPGKVTSGKAKPSSRQRRTRRPWRPAGRAWRQALMAPDCNGAHGDRTVGHGEARGSPVAFAANDEKHSLFKSAHGKRDSRPGIFPGIMAKVTGLAAMAAATTSNVGRIRSSISTAETRRYLQAGSDPRTRMCSKR